MIQFIVKTHPIRPIFLDVDTEYSTKMRKQLMRDNCAIPDHVNIADSMIFPNNTKVKGEVEGEGALFPHFLE